MSFACYKCGLELTTRHKLKAHLNKKYPCDFACSVCEFKGNNTRHLKTHLKKHTNDTKQNNRIRVAEIPCIQNDGGSETPPLFFPLDDFNWEGLISVEQEQKEEDVKQTALTEKKTLRKNETIIEQTKVITTTKTVTYRKIIRIRAKSIETDLKHQCILMSLKGLDPETDLAELIKQLMYNVHAQPDKPQFHSICNTDVNRGNVSVYNRIADSEKCRWISYQPTHVPTILNNHGRNLLMFLLQAGINILQIKFSIKHGCPVMYTTDDPFVIIVFVDKPLQQIRMMRTRQLEPKDFTLCSDEHENESMSLIKHVELRKQDIINALSDTTIGSEELDGFLKFSRPICIKSIK